MPTAPPVSVLLPVRDGAAHLAEAAASLEAQTFADFEVIAVDDGSTDGTCNLLQAWADRDDRVRWVRQDPAGIVAALERARGLAEGAVLARMDADDVAHPRRFERQAALLRTDPALVGVGAWIEYFPGELVQDGARRYQAWMNSSHTAGEVSRDLFVECPLAHPTFFLRADAVREIGGYRDRGWPEDYDLLLRLWRAGGSLAKVPEVLLRWREGDARLSRTHARYTPDAFRSCKAHHLRKAFDLGAREVVIWGAGPVGKAFSRTLGTLGVRVAAFADVDPRKIGQEVHGAPVVDTPAGLSMRGPLHLAAVGQPGVRERLRELLSGAGLIEGTDFVAVA